MVFFVGYTFAPTAYYKEVRWLTAYPLWLSDKLERLSKVKWNPLVLFFLLIVINSISLFVALLTGLIPILPILYALSMGFNIGVITYHTLKGRLYYAALINPVALFELPAAFISFTMAFQYNMKLMNLHILNIEYVSFKGYMNIFLLLVIPLLAFASIIETVLIMISRKIRMNDEDNDE
ncbi:MAG: stage II sporulation protein M [Calditrichaceae bacterium]